MTVDLNTLRVSPAAHLADLMEEATVTGARSVGLRELPFVPQLGVRVVPGTPSAAALESVYGLSFPTAHGETSGDASGVHALWLSPDEFLVVDASRRQTPSDSAAGEAALEGLPGQVVDLSGNRTVLELTGASARDLLEKFCHQDLHPRAFGVGSAVVTGLGPVPVYLHRYAEEGFRIYVRASFADYLVRVLVDGMVEYAGPAVA
ncbi:MAG: sarcosine oxidase subunit gamma [Galactobacter sp.]|uniref:sarcosine oxidase subunit gamma n=1 Tax=Galactobacter sp. TaxID=2676125 RepID=UPI00345DA082